MSSPSAASELSPQANLLLVCIYQMIPEIRSLHPVVSWEQIAMSTQPVRLLLEMGRYPQLPRSSCLRLQPFQTLSILQQQQ